MLDAVMLKPFRVGPQRLNRGRRLRFLDKPNHPPAPVYLKNAKTGNLIRRHGQVEPAAAAAGEDQAEDSVHRKPRSRSWFGCRRVGERPLFGLARRLSYHTPATQGEGENAK